MVLIRQPAQRIAMHGQTFVSNLFWQPLSNVRNAAQEARAFGVQNGWTWGVIRSGARAQAGFAECGHAVRTFKGAISLAALLAAQLGDAWLGAFKVSSGRYAVVAVHEMWIIPGFDVICDAEHVAQLWSEARRVYAFDAGALFAPPELGLAATERDIAPLLAARRWYAACRIKRLSWNDAYPKRLAAGAVLALAGLGLAGYWAAAIRSKSTAARLETRPPSARRAQPPRLSDARSSSATAVLHPWAQQTSATAFAQICATAIGALPLNLAGWHFKQARCEDRFVTAQFKRQIGATVEGFLLNAAARWRGIHPLFDEHDQALLHLPIEPVSTAVDDALPPATQLIARFISHFQRYGIQPNLQPVAQRAALGRRAEHSEPDTDQDWRQLHFNVHSAQPPVFHFNRLAQRGVSRGVRIRTITATLEQAALKWRIEGDLYVQHTP